MHSNAFSRSQRAWTWSSAAQRASRLAVPLGAAVVATDRLAISLVGAAAMVLVLVWGSIFYPLLSFALVLASLLLAKLHVFGLDL